MTGPLPNLEQLIKNFSDGGWESLAAATDRGDAEKARRESKQQAIANDVLWVAMQPQGRRVLDFILANSICRASWHGDLRFSIEQAASYGLLREGQNSMAAMLIAALRHATGGDTSILTKGDETHVRANRFEWRAFIGSAFRWITRCRPG